MRKSGRLGMSLPEIALVMLVIASLAGGAAYLMPSKKISDDIEILNQRLDKIEKAIYTYFLDKGRLPCPASRTNLIGSANFGVPTDCNAAAPSGVTDITPGTLLTALRNGVVPVRALNLPDSYMFDPWGNRINYSVIKKAAIDNTNFTDLESSITEDIIKIRDESNNQLNLLYTATNKIFLTHVLYSNGKNRNGGTNSSGTTATCASGSLDFENCNGDNIFRYANHNYTDGANYNDDIVRWYTNRDLYNCAGATKASACNIPPVGFTPNDIYGLITWIDANDYSMFTWHGGTTDRVYWLTEKSNETDWFDCDGDPNLSPLWQATGFNGKPTLNMAGTKGIFYCPDNGTPQSGTNIFNYTVFFAGEVSGVLNENYLLTSNTNSSDLYINVNNNDSTWYVHNSNYGTQTASPMGNMFFSIVFDITAPAPQVKGYINGSLVYTSTTYSGFRHNNLFKNIGIGRVYSNPTTSDFDGKLSEFLIYKRALTDSERQYVENYLKAKWGL
jgi:type II secretory pathway pseudopilin PulG